MQDGCETVCVDESCQPIPVEWIGTITITDTLLIYPTSACLCEGEDGGLEIQGEGEASLPNLQTDEDDPLLVTFTLDVVDPRTLAFEAECVHFSGTWEEGVPIGETGLLLTSMEGNVVFDPEPAVRASATIESEAQAPDGSGPAMTGEGVLWISLEEPYEVTFEGSLEVLDSRFVEVELTIDQSWGLAGSASLTGPTCSGPMFLHLWSEADDEIGITGSSSLTCTLEAGSLTPEDWPTALPGIPQEDLTVAAEGELGTFCVAWTPEGECSQEAAGVWVGAAFEPSWPENLVEPGVLDTRFFLSPTGVFSVTTNLERCEDQTPVPVDQPTQPRFCYNAAPTASVTRPSTAEESGNGSYTVRWTADDADDDALISLYYDRDAEGRDGKLVACCFGEGDDSTVWDTSEVPSGSYYVYARIDDGKNLAQVSYSAGTVKVENSEAPATPTGLAIDLEGGWTELSWTANTEADVAGYRVYYGSEADSYTGSYDATNVTQFRLPQPRRAPDLSDTISGTGVGGVRNLQQAPARARYMAVSAYDSSGNESSMGEPVRLWSTYLPALFKNPQ